LRRLPSGSIALVVFATLALIFVALFLPGRRHSAVDVYVLFLGAVGLAAAVRATRAASPDVHEPSLAHALDADPVDILPERPAELERLEREVYLALSNGFYLHRRVRPLLREIASHRLLVRHGIDLDARPETAAALVGEPAWSWLRPDRVEPRDRWAKGPPISELRAVVDALERI
jgi:hypothetical protein